MIKAATKIVKFQSKYLLPRINDERGKNSANGEKNPTKAPLTLRATDLGDIRGLVRPSSTGMSL